VIATEPHPARGGRARRFSCGRPTRARSTDLGSPRPRLAARRSQNGKHAAAPATVRPTGDPDRIEIEFDQPQRAVTPGQAAVMYSGDLVLGGGWIE
jgi:tRNA U34 2-thiouridine synthase MnmA/TrmU